MRQEEFNRLLRGFVYGRRWWSERDYEPSKKCIHTKAEMTLYRVCTTFTLGVVVAVALHVF